MSLMTSLKKPDLYAHERGLVVVLLTLTGVDIRQSLGLTKQSKQTVESSTTNGVSKRAKERPAEQDQRLSEPKILSSSGKAA